MNEDIHHAPGLTADWLNGWLAAVGITVLVTDARLAWTDSAVPAARLCSGGDLYDAIAAALPSIDEIDALCIARHHPDAVCEMDRTVTSGTFRERAALSRAHFDPSLECTVTDLAADDKGGLAHGPLDPSAPKGVTIHERLRSLRLELEGEGLASKVRLSLEGRGRRVRMNGLGFDHRRFPAGTNPDTQPCVDPVVEILAFAGLSLLPVRGPGMGRDERQRGWTRAPSRPGAFTWPTWNASLDRWAVDALLDRFWSLDTCRSTPGGKGQRSLSHARLSARYLGVSGAFASVYRQPKSSNDTGRGYASERVW